MANIDWGAASNGATRTITESDSTASNVSYMNDENDATALYVTGTGVPLYGTLEAKLTFSKAVPIDSFRVVIKGATLVAPNPRPEGFWWWLDTGVHVLKPTFTWPATKTEYTYSSGPYQEATQLAITITGLSTTNAAFIYTLEALGPDYTDVGMRIDAGASNAKIAVVPLDGHKVRIHSGGTTYGLPLVATDHVFASPLRIYDGSTVYSTVDYDLALP